MEKWYYTISLQRNGSDWAVPFHPKFLRNVAAGSLASSYWQVVGKFRLNREKSNTSDGKKFIGMNRTIWIQKGIAVLSMQMVSARGKQQQRQRQKWRIWLVEQGKISVLHARHALHKTVHAILWKNNVQLPHLRFWQKLEQIIVNVSLLNLVQLRSFAV